MCKNNKIYVTQPSLPELKEFIPYLEEIWNSKWLTNNGLFHQQFEKGLADFLGVKYICLVANGTLALMLALKALDIKGEVITSPFSFVATAHSILWNNSEPVFCDIEEKTLNINPSKIEQLITENTTAIIPVHVYGHPCDNDKIQAIAKKRNLKVIYDAAHAFYVKQNDNSILNWGDLSILSFHATKVFNTFEGGAIICHNKAMKNRINHLKNFGFAGETSVVTPGINAKMNEFQAALGLVQLNHIDEEIACRKRITNYYRKKLKHTPGIRFLHDSPEVKHNYSYMPIFIDERNFGKSRDALYTSLKQNDIFTRRYFYPLISNFEPYKNYKSAKFENLPIANKIAEQVLCLPIYADLTFSQVDRITAIIKDAS